MRNSSDKAITFKKGDTIKTYKYDISDYDDFIVNTQKNKKRYESSSLLDNST
ncbi:hypothetical protein I6I59_09305 [Campylobacter ureolyticus]|uniref:hypothetical protein n=1 Tax=Campylobacter ureolyticus TaxID=827 RepID=UPI00192CBF0D|nr:hypothetical protein [Campylobacter ureolyticus]QQY35667.1 hypothetical protein I6I59_09305 [Campylobacter ureolyticus]